MEVALTEKVNIPEEWKTKEKAQIPNLAIKRSRSVSVGKSQKT
jgi:hypothetical protein